MRKKVVFLSFMLAVLVGGFVNAAQLDPIPDGFNIVIFANNHSNLPLGDILSKAPLPQEPRAKIETVLNETGFNPLRDISQIQLMVKKAEEKKDDEWVILLTGKFDKDKIMAFLKKVNAPIEEDKIGEQAYLKSKDGKAALCFFSPEKIALAKPDSLKIFIETRGGKAPSTAFEGLKGMMSEKAYATIMVAGNDFLKMQLDKKHEKMKQWATDHPDDPRVKNPLSKWFHGYFREGMAPTGIFANLLDDKIEAKILYDRGDAKGCFAHALLEVGDPKLKIETIFQEFLKILPDLKPGAGDHPEKK